MSDSQNAAASLFTGSFLLVTLLIGVASIVLAVVIYWKIFSKAGYNGAMGLLMFIPIANFIAILILAFGEWPIHRELNDLRARAGMGGNMGMGGGQPYPPNR